MLLLSLLACEQINWTIDYPNGTDITCVSSRECQQSFGLNSACYDYGYNAYLMDSITDHSMQCDQFIEIDSCSFYPEDFLENSDTYAEYTMLGVLLDEEDTLEIQAIQSAAQDLSELGFVTATCINSDEALLQIKDTFGENYRYGGNDGFLEDIQWFHLNYLHMLLGTSSIVTNFSTEEAQEYLPILERRNVFLLSSEIQASRKTVLSSTELYNELFNMNVPNDMLPIRYFNNTSILQDENSIQTIKHLAQEHNLTDIVILFPENGIDRSDWTLALSETIDDEFSVHSLGYANIDEFETMTLGYAQGNGSTLVVVFPSNDQDEIEQLSALAGYFEDESSMQTQWAIMRTSLSDDTSHITIPIYSINSYMFNSDDLELVNEFRSSIDTETYTEEEITAAARIYDLLWLSALGNHLGNNMNKDAYMILFEAYINSYEEYDTGTPQSAGTTPSEYLYQYSSTEEYEIALNAGWYVGNALQNISDTSKESIALHKDNWEQLTTDIDITNESINVHGVSGNLDLSGEYLDILTTHFAIYSHTTEGTSELQFTCSASECE